MIPRAIPKAHKTPTTVSALCLFFSVTAAMIIAIASANPTAPVKRRNPQEKGQSDAAVSGVSDSTRDENDPVYNDERSYDPASHAGEQSGKKSVAHEFGLEDFEHFSGVLVVVLAQNAMRHPAVDY